MAFVDWFVEKFPPKIGVSIFCGTGNNGGDGLVIGRLLKAEDYQVNVCVIRVGDQSSPDFQTNYERLSKLMKIQDIKKANQLPEIKPNQVVIEGIFGSGLSRPAEGLFSEVIDHINQCSGRVVAIDIASGLFSDEPTAEEGSVIQPDYTISFQVPKLAFFMPSNQKFVGKWIVVNIGLDKKFISDLDTPYYYLLENYLRLFLKARSKYSHKGNFGKALLVAGSLGKMGAAVLSARACLRTGVGLLTVHLPGCGYEVVQTAVPEAMVSLDDGQEFISSVAGGLAEFDAIGIGPGLGTQKPTRTVLAGLMEKYGRPLVIDADGLNIIGENRELLNLIPPESILTPHPREFERLTGPSTDDFARIRQQIEFSSKYRVYLVLKGAHTSVTTPDGGCYFNTTGNPGMATAGSGDVLTGVLTSLIAQGYSPFKASMLGVFLHGLAGDFAESGKGQESLIASDIIESIPAAFQRLHSQA